MMKSRTILAYTKLFSRLGLCDDPIAFWITVSVHKPLQSDIRICECVLSSIEGDVE